MIELVPTADGSFTLINTSLSATYHSKHGAITESLHVFIKNGLYALDPLTGTINVLEIGVGSGLNAFLLLLECIRNPGISIHYTGIEPIPLRQDILAKFELPDERFREQFMMMHRAPEITKEEILPGFVFSRICTTLDQVNLEGTGHLVFFDAFGPETQPELWTPEALRKTTDWLKPGGVWVSYCAKGDVRRALQSFGLKVNRLPGPPYKRHMLQAVKL